MALKEKLNDIKTLSWSKELTFGDLQIKNWRLSVARGSTLSDLNVKKSFGKTSALAWIVRLSIIMCSN